MKKSKFLKKSLAMLLALMLVVAMIPLSAAASPVNLGAIYVDGNRVELAESMTVDVTDQSLNNGFSITTNEDLIKLGAELRIYKKDGVTYTPAPQVSANPTGLTLNDYLVNGNTIKLALYDLGTTNGTGDDVELGSYTLTLKKVQGSTTTNLSETYVAGKGVVSATIDNVTKTINVKLARHDNQVSLGAELTVTTVDNATITGSTGGNYTKLEDVSGGAKYTIPADNGDTINVTSQTGGNVSKFTVVATYEDALATMEIQGLDGKWYSGSIVDTNPKDDIPDAIIFNLPDVAVEDPAHPGEKVADPKLNVRYTTQGDVDSNVVVTVVDDDGNSNDTNVKSGKEGSRVTFTDLTVGDEAIATGSKVVVTRLSTTDGAVQTYDLTVQLQKSTVTTIEYARVNDTIATVNQETGSITAELPKYQDTPNAGTTDPSKSKLVVYTDPSVSSVVVNGVALEKITKDKAATLGQLDYDAATAEGKIAWVSVSGTTPAANVDLSKKQIITVTAEDEQTTKQYTISASISQNTSDADITAFWLKNGGNTYEGKFVNKDTIQVNVPYMTTSVADWVVYVTPTAGAKVEYAGLYEVVNGWHKGSNIDLTNVNEGAVGATTKLTAINKNNEKISHEYTINVVLDTAKTGNTLNSLEFTAQNTDNNNDKVVYRAIQRTGSQKNTFNAEVDQQSNLTNNVGNITLEVPVSLSNNAAYTAAGISYHNVVTGFATDNGGVAYGVYQKGSTNYALKKLYATTNDISAKAPQTGAVLVNSENDGVDDGSTYSQIVVLPEKYARTLDLGADQNGVSKMLISTVEQYGTIYNVVIETANAQTGHDLQSMSFGNTPLTIEGDTIKGELPYSLTADTVANGKAKAMFATFETSQYAALFMTNWTKAGTQYMYSGTFTSDGDTNGDGETDPMAYHDNYGFFFVRNPDHTVEVYAYEKEKGATYNLSTSVDSNSSNGTGFETGISVLAEDRLSGSKTSFSNYKFELTWAEPCRDADIESFKLGNYTGSIDGNRNITVTVPYGTDVTGMIATFTTSVGATIQVGSENSGVALISDVTSVNYTNPVKLYVTSESGNVTRMYTVTVEEGVSFSDVTAGAWYYENVMGAAENGYVSGYPDGTFKPMQSVTRAEFASMIAKAMGYDSDPDAGSAYPDVADDHWAKAAINFCAQNDIINGYDDGTFQPNKAITRQEAAAILNKAFELSVKYGVSTDLFPDNSSIAAWASDHVYAAKASGLMKGYEEDGTFRPNNQITRAEAASILMNAKYADLIK